MTAPTPINRRCPTCQRLTLCLTSEPPTCDLTPPLVDLDEYQVWRCSDAECTQTPVQRKPDGAPTRDRRYIDPVGVLS